MPRRHKPLKNQSKRPTISPEAGKVRYPSKHAAEHAAKEVSKYNLDVNLRTYQSPINGGWYLTSIGSDPTD
ncbi:hypothetical protein H7Y29_02680 [Microbacteriaceae bacterium]|nr:hypothetical protein [Candidatus Saccharibacteria bacterium]